jgi:hypothetical protein
MPFKSKVQMRYLYAKVPEFAKEFASKTTSIKTLPDRKMQLEIIKKRIKK